MVKYKVLFVNHEDDLVGGSSKSLLNMLHSVRDVVAPIILLRKEGPVHDFFKSEGYECVVIPFRRITFQGTLWKRIYRSLPHFITNSFINLRCILRASRLVREEGISIIHSNSSVIDVGYEIARFTGVKHVWHLREFVDAGLGVRFFGGYKRWKRKVDKSDAVIVISSQLRSYLGYDGVANVFCIPDAVCGESDTVFLKEKDKYFLFCSAKLSSVKHPEVAIEAFEKSGLAREGYRLVFTGNIDDGYKDDLLSLVIDKSLLHVVDFIGYVPDVKGLMSNAAGYLMCSEFEGLGRVTIEAMFYGCPVIARRSGGTLEIVEDNVNGFMYDSPNECSSLMRHVAGNLPERIIIKAQETAVRRFSEESFRAELLRVYDYAFSRSTMFPNSRRNSSV